MAPTSIPDQSIAKSGWLLRRSTVLRRWKKSWFVLYQNGRFGFYEHEHSSAAEDLVDIPYERAIIVGPDYCRDVEPPSGKSYDLMFGVKTRGKVWHMCAEDKDDLMAWKLALQEALSIALNRGGQIGNQGTAGAYAGYVMPSNNYGYGPGQYTIYAPPGSTVTVSDRGPVIAYPDGRVVHVFEQNPYYRNYCGNAGLGFLTGAALGSMLFWPWWGMWWWF